MKRPLLVVAKPKKSGTIGETGLEGYLKRL